MVFTQRCSIETFESTVCVSPGGGYLGFFVCMCRPSDFSPFRRLPRPFFFPLQSLPDTERRLRGREGKWICFSLYCLLGPIWISSKFSLVRAVRSVMTAGNVNGQNPHRYLSGGLQNVVFTSSIHQIEHWL